MQDFMVTGLFAGQHNTKLHGTNAGVIICSCHCNTFVYYGIIENTLKSDYSFINTTAFKCLPFCLR